MAPRPPDDGDSHVKEAKKALKTSVLHMKFKSDKDTAAMEFHYAAQEYQKGGRLHEAIGANIQSAELKEELCDAFGAARSWEAAATISETMTKDWGACVEYLEKAEGLYQQANKISSCVRVLLKISRISEEKTTDVPRAKKAFQRCFDVYDIDGANEHQHDLVELCRSYVDFLGRHEMYNEMVGVLDRQLKCHKKLKQTGSMPKVVLGMVVVCLKLDDVVGAERCLTMECGVVMASREHELGREVVEAWRCCDAEGVRKVLSSQTCMYLALEIARIARSLQVPVSDGDNQSQS
eukprot:CAMPEP_0113848366 /NCGR_PEP_ID=MMETSP0372-20130328/2435_1 /TAXON_ID=340204 /ORGANISM="Lankesteria abbotti" /LENGTH=292 /DNA_ID=CAMNT_0000817837 /DNA_START=167 /DNA_END=1042 /DNA_ORIENTATION=- /assembly_acc=CAM_ASM_000359